MLFHWAKRRAHVANTISFGACALQVQATERVKPALIVVDYDRWLESMPPSMPAAPHHLAQFACHWRLSTR